MRSIHSDKTYVGMLVGLILTICNPACADNEQERRITTQNKSVPHTIDVKKCRLKRYKVQYEIIDGDSKVGHAERSLTMNDGEAHLRSNVSASIVFFEFTQTELSNIPNYQTKGFQSANYFKSKKKPFKKIEKTNYSIPQANGFDNNISTQRFDPLSVYDQLRELVCSAPGADISLTVQEEKELEIYQFSYRGIQEFQIPMGSVQAILMVRTRETSTRETSIWFDVNNNYLPVKIQQDKDGDTQALLVATSANATKD